MKKTTATDQPKAKPRYPWTLFLFLTSVFTWLFLWLLLPDLWCHGIPRDPKSVIRQGMTEAEVLEAMVVPPGKYRSRPPGFMYAHGHLFQLPPGGKVLTWDTDELYVEVFIDTERRVVWFRITSWMYRED